MEENKLNNIDFKLTLDENHWKLLCKQASHLTTTPSHLIAMIFEYYLVKTGYLDPDTVGGKTSETSVSLADLRNNPSKLFNFLPNQLLPKSEEETFELKEETKESPFKGFFE